MAARSKRPSSSSSSNRNGGQRSKPKGDHPEIQCWNCKTWGHHSGNCDQPSRRKKKKNEEEASSAAAALGEADSSEDESVPEGAKSTNAAQ